MRFKNLMPDAPLIGFVLVVTLMFIVFVVGN